MDFLNELEELGVNTEDALERFSGNSSLYIRMIGKFPASINGLEVMPCIESGDLAAAVTNAHTIKGVTGNLSITPLFKSYTEIVNELRAGNADKAKEILNNILPVQKKILDCIEKNKQ